MFEGGVRMFGEIRAEKNVDIFRVYLPFKGLI